LGETRRKTGWAQNKRHNEYHNRGKDEQRRDEGDPDAVFQGQLFSPAFLFRREEGEFLRRCYFFWENCCFLLGSWFH
jgi:hypothetical protein